MKSEHGFKSLSITSIVSSLLILTSVFPMKVSLVTVAIQLLLFLLLADRLSFKKEFLLLIFSIIVSVFTISFFNIKLDYKQFLLFSLFILMYSSLNIDKGTVASSVKICLIILFLSAVLQKLTSPDIWYFLSENDAHYRLYEVGYSTYSTLGNSTHSGYIVLIMSALLLSLKEMSIKIFLIALVSLFLFSNKVSIVVFLAISFFYVLSSSLGGIRKLLFFISFMLICFLIWEFALSSYYIKWKNTSVEDIHTINHRLSLFLALLEELSEPSFWLNGDPDFIEKFDMAFDSGVILLIFNYGVLFTAFIYFSFVWFLRKNVYFLIALTAPSLSMVAFYNTHLIIPIAVMVLALQEINSKERFSYE